MFLGLHDSWGLDFQRRLLPAQQTGLIETGLTTQSEIDNLVAAVDGAIEHGVHRWTSRVIVTMIAEVPG